MFEDPDGKYTPNHLYSSYGCSLSSVFRDPKESKEKKQVHTEQSQHLRGNGMVAKAAGEFPRDGVYKLWTCAKQKRRAP